MMCMDFWTRNASASAITISKFTGGRTARTGVVLQCLAGAVLGGAILAAAGADAVMAKDLKRAQAKDGDPKTAFAQVKVEYLKICSLYGGGFYYIPGTDTCIRFGGFVGMDAGVNAWPFGGPDIGGALPVHTGPLSDRTTVAAGVDGILSLDLRTMTQYGPVRSYFRGGFELYGGTNVPDFGGSTGAVFYNERSFIQFAGFTAGRAQSYFDWAAKRLEGDGPFGNGPFGDEPFAYGAFTGGGSNTAKTGVLLAAFTAQFGNGVSWTIAVEDGNARRNAIWDRSAFDLAIGAFPGPTATWGGYNLPVTCVTPGTAVGTTAPTDTPGCGTGSYASQQIPDIVSSLRVDQAWGSAQVSAALHQVRSGFYGGAPASDAWGWAVMGGAVLNLPWNPGDKFWVEATYSEGAPAFNGFTQFGGNGNFDRFDGRNVGAAWALDGILGVPGPRSPVTGGLVLPKTWDIAAAVQHYWTPRLRTSLFGSVTAWDPGADGNAIMCGGGGGSGFNTPVRTVAGAPPAGVPLAGCDFGFAVWAVGSRTVFSPEKSLDVGVEVMYSQINTKFDPGKIRLDFAGAGGRPAGLYTPSDEGIWSGLVRVQRNFWP